jgi:hypothetical protein
MWADVYVMSKLSLRFQESWTALTLAVIVLLKSKSLDESSARHESTIARTRDRNSHFWSTPAACTALRSASHRLVCSVLGSSANAAMANTGATEEVGDGVCNGGYKVA